ncbi:MAG: DUF2079 domain-containing protein [bacterium]
MKKDKKGLKYKKIISLFLCAIVVGGCGALFSPFISSIFLLSWIAFSFFLARLKLVKDNLYSVLLKTAISYPFLLIFLIIPKIPLNYIFWRYILLTVGVGGFVFFMTLLEYRYKDISKKICFILLFFFVFAYIGIYSYLNIIQYNVFLNGHDDLALFDQIMWNTLKGKILHIPLRNSNFLGDHMSPILIFLSPFYLIWKDPKMLLILKSVFLGLAAFPVYLIAKDRLKNNLLSLSFSISYLFHPFLSRIAVLEFYEVCLAPFFLLFCFYFLQRRNWILYFIFLLFSLMVKEDISLIVATLGIYSFFRVNKKIGIITFLMGIFWAYLSVGVLMPYIRETTSGGEEKAAYRHFGRYTFGSTPSEFVKNLIFKPDKTLKLLISPIAEKLGTLFLLFLPFGFFSIFSLTIFVAFSEIILHFLSYWPFQYLLASIYSAPIIPFCVVSSIYGLQFLFKKKLNPYLGFYILVLSFLSNYYFCSKALTWRIHDCSYCNPNFYNLNEHRTIFSFPSKETFKIYYQTRKERELFELLKKIIPEGTPISVQDNLLAHFSRRKAPLYIFPNFENADYVIINNYGLSRGWLILWTGGEACSKKIEDLLKNPRFQIFFKCELSGEGEAIYLFGKKARKEKIIKMGKKLVKSDPSLSEAHFILGSIYFNSNRLKEAKESIVNALRLSSENSFAKQMLEECKKKMVDKN